MSYEFTKSVDGEDRTSVNLGTERFTLRDIAVYAANEVEHDVPYDNRHDRDWLHKFLIKRLRSRGETIKAVRKTIWAYGGETPHYRIGDGNVSEEIFDETLDRVIKLWK